MYTYRLCKLEPRKISTIGGKYQFTFKSNKYKNSEFLQQIFGEVVHNNILYVLSMSNLKQIFLPFSREAIFYFVLQPLGWNEL